MVAGVVTQSDWDFLEHDHDARPRPKMPEIFLSPPTKTAKSGQTSIS